MLNNLILRTLSSINSFCLKLYKSEKLKLTKIFFQNIEQTINSFTNKVLKLFIKSRKYFYGESLTYFHSLEFCIVNKNLS